MNVLMERRLFSVEEYHRMAEVGILGSDDRVELIDGELVTMAPIGKWHASRVSRLDHLFQKAAADDALVWVQSPISLPPRSEPQPDIALLKPRADFYASALPAAQDVLLIVEVADTSLAYDRDIKLKLYARHGIPEFWILDREHLALEIHREPSAKGYRITLRPEAAESISPVAVPRVVINVGDLFVGLD